MNEPSGQRSLSLKKHFKQHLIAKIVIIFKSFKDFSWNSINSKF